MFSIYFWVKKTKFDFFLFFLDLVQIFFLHIFRSCLFFDFLGGMFFFGFYGFFSKLLRSNRATKKALAKGQSAPQELEVGPRSGPYILVYIKVKSVKYIFKWEFYSYVRDNENVCLFKSQSMFQYRYDSKIRDPETAAHSPDPHDYRKYQFR